MHKNIPTQGHLTDHPLAIGANLLGSVPPQRTQVQMALLLLFPNTQQASLQVVHFLKAII